MIKSTIKTPHKQACFREQAVCINNPFTKVRYREIEEGFDYS
jgi:hypothetical protein